jgi:hypothetical protein
MDKPHHFTTPCGFEIYLIPLATDTLRWRVFYGAEEIGFDRMRDRLSREGAVMLAGKINALYGGNDG